MTAGYIERRTAELLEIILKKKEEIETCYMHIALSENAIRELKLAAENAQPDCLEPAKIQKKK